MTTLLLGRICRTCLLESSTMHKLLETKHDNLQIDEMLSKAVPNFQLSLEEENNDSALPVEICSDCLDKLQVSYRFQQMCLASNERLRNIFTHQEEADIIAQEMDLTALDLLKNTNLHEKDDENEYVLQEMLNAKDSQKLITEITIVRENNFETVKEELETGIAFVVEDTMEELELKNEIEEMEINENDVLEYDDNQTSSDPDDNYFANEDKVDDERKTPDVSDNPKGKVTRKYKKRSSAQKESNKTCPECNKVFKKRMFLTRHMSVHSPEHQFVCDICQYRYATDKLLKIHTSYKHNSGIVIRVAGGPYQCPDCPMIFQQTRALAAHRVVHLERDFKCKICGINLKTLAAVTRHMNCKHPGVLPYKCEMCDQAFPVETHYNDHVNLHKGYKKHKCDMCDKSFPNTTALKDHVRTHTGESPYLCSHCGKSFKTANILRQHLQRHGDKNFQCPECPMRFYVKVNLQKHMCTHSKEKPYVCDVCGSSFTRGDSLKAHKFKHSGERPFKCEECSMSFVFKRHLIRHRITHTGEKPHMCTYCDRAYAASGDLVKHLRTHLGENTYFCDECPQAFKYQHDLRDHKNQHYKKKSETGNEEGDEEMLTSMED